MIKKTVQYKDYNGDPHTDDLYFHLTVNQITDNLDLSDQLEAAQEMLAGEKRELVTAEKQQMLNLVKRFIRLSYGVRSEDGAKFRDGVRFPELWDDFVDSAAYDAFLWALFLHPEQAVSFMNDIMPAEAIAKAKEEIAKRKQPQDRRPKATAAVDVLAQEPKVSESEQIDLVVEDEETPEEKRARLKRELAELG